MTTRMDRSEFLKTSGKAVVGAGLGVAAANAQEVGTPAEDEITAKDTGNDVALQSDQSRR